MLIFYAHMCPSNFFSRADKLFAILQVHRLFYFDHISSRDRDFYCFIFYLFTIQLVKFRRLEQVGAQGFVYQLCGR